MNKRGKKKKRKKKSPSSCGVYGYKIREETNAKKKSLKKCNLSVDRENNHIGRGLGRTKL